MTAIGPGPSVPRVRRTAGIGASRPFAVRPSEGPLTEPIAATQPWLRVDRLHASDAKLS
jgi:hypothetical protein